MSAATAMIQSGMAASAMIMNSCLEGIEQDQGSFCIADNTNSFERIAGHIVAARHGLATFLGMEVTPLSWGSFGDFSHTAAFETESTPASLEDIRSAWNQIHNSFMKGLSEVTEETFNKPSPFDLPGLEKSTLGDLLPFLFMHETYHVGQLGLMKKVMTGKGAMQE